MKVLTFFIGLFLVLFALLVVGLFTIPLAGAQQFTQEVAGFWYGLWHGMIAWITFIWHFFDPSVKIYEPSNSGGWYDFGFLMGISCAAGGSSSSASSRSKKSR